jgi:hypothetical protein
MAETEFYAKTAMHGGCGRKEGKGENARSVVRSGSGDSRKEGRERGMAVGGGHVSMPILGAVAHADPIV